MNEQTEMNEWEKPAQILIHTHIHIHITHITDRDKLVNEYIFDAIHYYHENGVENCLIFVYEIVE